MRFTYLTILRITLLLATVLVFSWIFGDPRLFFNQIILGLIIVAQVVELVRFVNHTNRELSKLFLAIKHEDFSVTFKEAKLGRSFQDLQSSMTGIIDAYKQVKIEKEAQYHFLQMMVNQIQIGIISMVNDDILLINPTAEKLLHIQGIKNWKLIQQLNPSFAKEFSQLGDNGRKLIETTTAGEAKILAVDVSTQIILDKPSRLITLQDINSEIEQKEIEAWHKLIRILTHEIMNSITPISSLTETMQGMLSDTNGQQKALSSLEDETISDIRFSLSTIQKRSEGLLRFVEDYRKLTRVPKPVKELVDVVVFANGLDALMSETLLRQDIKLAVEVGDPQLKALFDPALVEQVMINLITNSSHALENRPEKTIRVKVYRKENQLTFEVIDTGKGIPQKELKEIFIPFFSTKKEGSGIGLSLSKQIVAQHGGTIKATSQPGVGTTFTIQLPLQ